MSDTNSDIPEVDPPWGSLIVEKYLLQHWDPHSSEHPDQQRKRLVRAYIAAGSQRPGLVHDQSEATGPTVAEISSVLQPWRTLAQRKIPSSGMVRAVWLRTCYAEGSDQKHNELVEKVDMDMAVDGDDRLLNDPNLYNFGPEWQHVFDFLPELVEPQEQSDWALEEEMFSKAVDDLKSFAAKGVTGAPKQLLDNLSLMRGEELEQEVATALQSSVHEACVVNWIVLEDEEALRSGDVMILFLDVFGRVVRQKRMPAAQAEDMGGLWVDGSWMEVDWVDAEIGEEYREGGACENLLLQNILDA